MFIKTMKYGKCFIYASVEIGEIAMRRKDREVTERMKIENIINRCTCCRIGFHDDEEVYIALVRINWSCNNAKNWLYK